MPGPVGAVASLCSQAATKPCCNQSVLTSLCGKMRLYSQYFDSTLLHCLRSVTTETVLMQFVTDILFWH